MEMVPTSTGCPLSWQSLDLLDDRAELARLGLVDDVVVVDADDGPVRRDLDDVQLVDGGEFLLLGHAPCRSCRRACRKGGRKFWNVMVASVLFSLATDTPSLASMA